MSNNLNSSSQMDKPIKTKDEQENVESPEISEVREGTQRKMHGIMQQMEMMAMQRSNRNNLDISTFDKDQKDKLLNLMEKNEDNAFAYSTKRLEIQAKLNSKALEASSVVWVNGFVCYNVIDSFFQRSILHSIFNVYNWLGRWCRIKECI